MYWQHDCSMKNTENVIFRKDPDIRCRRSRKIKTTKKTSIYNTRKERSMKQIRCYNTEEHIKEGRGFGGVEWGSKKTI